MADSLVLTGVKDVKKHTGSEMLLTRPKRGGDTHALKEWWKGGAGKCYVQCTVFKVTAGPDSVLLAIDTNMSTNLRIDHDGAFGFTFYGINEVRRAALFTTDYALIEHYVFPAISGGKVMTVTPAGAAPKPDGTVAPTIGTPAIAGNANPDADTDGLTYIVALSGGDVAIGDCTITWGTGGNLTIASGQGTPTVTIDSGDAGSAGVSVSVAYAGASNTPVTDDLDVTIA